ncbi:MAG: HAD family phosphatase [Chlamydiia bacterium]|nr:HAD family phosphatase [Chlamydiia bacterium]
MYSWLNHFQLYLFDFDGLLVNTEETHYLAYKRMCERRGFAFPFSFEAYCKAAHYESEAFKHRIYEAIPELVAQEPSWDVLYAEKKQAVGELLDEGTATLMPGVESFLTALDKTNAKKAVVTNSPDTLVNILRKQHPILSTIPHWITRHHYTHAKPHPESYLAAISKLHKEGERIIGFEDTPRGIRALLETPALPIMISATFYPEIPTFQTQGILHYPSFQKIQAADIQ